MKILVATTNEGKIKEIFEIVSGLGMTDIELESLKNYHIKEPQEPYDDFMQNAVHKAQYYASHSGHITLADDSGLCVTALNGFPGVKTKDFVNECGGLSNAFMKLQKMLGSMDASAYFQAAIAIYCPKKDQLIAYQDKDEGRLSFPARGHDGFGFDPIFIPNGYSHTMAELGLEVKNRISHRAKALAKVLGKLRSEFS